METRSLTEAKKILIEAISANEVINKADKVELMINLYLFLNENTYSENIELLKGKQR